MPDKRKRSSALNRPNRNALCLCGSGRAFKRCCAKKWAATPEKPDSLSNQLKRIAIVLVACVMVVGIVALTLNRPWVAEREGEPFEYDSHKDRYWHAGQGEWLDGRPPFHPWEYDPVRQQHFHPGYDEWRDGRPPRP